MGGTFLHWENFTLCVIFFLELRPKAPKISPWSKSMGKPTIYKNAITLPHIYLGKLISEALHFWSTFRPQHNLRKAHSALQLSKHCFVFFSLWELLPPASPKGKRAEPLVSVECSHESLVKQVVPLGSCTEETQPVMQHKMQSLSGIWTCSLSVCSPLLLCQYASKSLTWLEQTLQQMFPWLPLWGMLVAPCWRALRSGWELPCESKAGRRALHLQRAQPSSSC